MYLTKHYFYETYHDCAELRNWEHRPAAAHPAWSYVQVLNMSINYTRNPHVAQDNITDGKKVNGYEVKITTGGRATAR